MTTNDNRSDTTDTTDKPDITNLYTKKLEILSQLGMLKLYGFILTKDYDINDNYEDMKIEYEMHKKKREQENQKRYIEQYSMFIKGVIITYLNLQKNKEDLEKSKAIINGILNLLKMLL